VADSSEQQVLLCVNHINGSTNLFVSDLLGVKYALSLENIVYFNPEGANKDTWLKYVH
jgi:hypothetical protein